ncbi:hypothetical protein J3455_01445 [Pseudoalteromonas sp. NFXS39]|uniref:HNH endonuclease n=1 Tax=Pseudoalteromonas sp. NFXS39 TaxID=2818437 RepID=UPI0032DEBDE5
MSPEERLKYFEDNYDKIAEYHLGKGEKIHIVDDSKICRFCKKTEPEVTFRTVAHAVPEFLGNKQLILKNECDQCNTFVSNNLENSLDKYTKPFRLAAQIKGKKKVPTYRSKDKKSRYEFDPSNGARIIDPQDSDFASLDIENKEIRTKFHLEPYIPAAVYKCLVKIALSVIDNKELELFRNSLAWIMDENHEKSLCKPLIVLKTFIPGPKPNNILTVLVLRRKCGSIASQHCVLLICFGNVAYQIIVPSDVDVVLKQQKITFTRFPLPFEFGWPYGDVVFDVEDLTSHVVTKEKVLPMSFSFDEAIELDPNEVEL